MWTNKGRACAGMVYSRSKAVARKPPTSIRNFSTKKEKEEIKTLVQKMRKGLQKDSSASKQSGWEKLWKDGVTPWDLNMPTPVLKAELENMKIPLSTVLVPGCGSGHDLVTIAQLQQKRGLAAEDFVVVGLDISLTSLQQAEKVVVRNYSEDYSLKNNSPCLTLAHGDFFDCSTWQSMYCSNVDEHQLKATIFQEETFDLIFDHVFFCALPPNLRDAWGQAMSSLLKPETGRLLTLMFPVLGPNPEMKGPPYPVTLEDYQKVLEPNGVLMESSRPYESPHTIPERVGKELVCWWRRHDGNALRASL